MSFWKSLFGKRQSTLSASIVETAFSLGDNLATLQVLVGVAGQTQELMDISERLHKWWSKFSTGVPLELRMRKA